MAVYCVYKPKKMTSYQCVEAFRAKMNFGPEKVLGYAGRLDPMAEGLFLILEGEDNKRQADFFNLDKEYELDIVLGIETDSFDLLGIVKNKLDKTPDINNEALMAILERYKGQIEQLVPPYSAVRVKGKPLFWWAKQGRLDEIEIPKYKREIYDIELLDFKSIAISDFEAMTLDIVEGINGHFRQDEIKERWLNFFNNIDKATDFKQLKLRVSCSSGTFMRQLVNDIGHDLGCGAVLTSLIRTKLGQYNKFDINIQA